MDELDFLHSIRNQNNGGPDYKTKQWLYGIGGFAIGVMVTVAYIKFVDDQEHPWQNTRRGDKDLPGPD